VSLVEMKRESKKQQTRMKPELLDSNEITEQQVVKVESFIRDNLRLAKKFGPDFRSDLRDALAEAKKAYRTAGGSDPHLKTANQRQMKTLRNSMSVALRCLGQEEIRVRLMNSAPWPSVDSSDRDGEYRAYCEWRDNADAVIKKIDQLKLAIVELRGILDGGLKGKSKSTVAMTRLETIAVARAAAAFVCQIEDWDLPRGLWYHDLTPSPLVTIIVGALRIIGIKASKRGIAALKFELDPNFNFEVLGLPSRPRGKRS